MCYQAQHYLDGSISDYRENISYNNQPFSYMNNPLLLNEPWTSHPFFLILLFYFYKPICILLPSFLLEVQPTFMFGSYIETPFFSSITPSIYFSLGCVIPSKK
jgi:hypothetical protein